MQISKRVLVLSLAILGIAVCGTYLVLTKQGKQLPAGQMIRPATRVLRQDPSVKLINGKKLAEVSQQFEVEKQASVRGTTGVAINGAIYEVASNGTLAFQSRSYDAARLAASYLTEDGKTYRIDPAQPDFRVLMTKHFKEGFEDANTLGDLILTDDEIGSFIAKGLKLLTVDGVPHGWRYVTLNSPAQPQAASNSADPFARKLVTDSASFIDNRIEPSPAVVHTGSRSLHAYAVPPPANMVCTKASLHTAFLHFVKGDHVWFSGWFYFAESLPFTIMDLESSWLLGNSGIRLAIDGRGRLYVTLKALDKPQWRQTVDPPAVVPLKQWVNVKVHFVLDDENGLIELWQDGRKILDGRGTTLPLPKAIYNLLEVGVSAATHDRGPVSLYVDDVEISDKPF